MFISNVPKKMGKHLALSKNHWLQWQVELNLHIDFHH